MEIIFLLLPGIHIFSAMNRLLKVLLFFLCVFPLNAFSMTECDIDEFLIESFITMDSVESYNPHIVLNFLEELSDDIDTMSCYAERSDFLRRGASKLVSFEKDEGVSVLTLHKLKSLKKNSLNLTEEDYAVLSLFLEYVESKYNSAYGVSKGDSLKKKEEIEVLCILLSELADVDYGTIVSFVRNGLNGVAVSASTSWVYLWLRQDNPFKHIKQLDVNYDWMKEKREIFLEAFPNSKYAAAIKNLITDDVLDKKKQYDLSRRNFHFGINFLLGKTLVNSVLNPFSEDLAYSVSIFVQFFRIPMMAQLYGSIWERGISYGGGSMVAGYSFIDTEKFGLDVFGGLGFVFYDYESPEDSEEVKKTTSGSFEIGIQFLKRFPVSDKYSIVPKVQWFMNIYDFDNPVSGKHGLTVANHFFAGLAWEHRVPMGRPRD